MARSSEVVPVPDETAEERAGGATSLSERRAAAQSVARGASAGTSVGASAGAMHATSRAAMMVGRKWRGAARWIGLAIFALGAALIAYVFLEALRTFGRLDPGYLQMQVNRIAGDGMAQTTTAIFSVLGGELLRLLYLMLLGYLGSVMAGKGIQFFAASESVIDEAVVAGVDDDY